MNFLKGALVGALIVAVALVVTQLLVPAVTRWWRWVTVDGLKKFALLCTGFFVILSAYNTYLQRQGSARNSQILRNSAETVQIIRDQTSPEAQARTQQQIDGILLQVDCNTRSAFQDAIRQLVEVGIPEAGSIRIVTAECEDRGN